VLIAAITIAGIGKVITFLVMLSILITLHEYGHFLVARRNGVRVNEFSIGMGPQLYGWTSPKSGTLYSLRALPIGGYCAMQGEDNKTNEAEQQREFLAAQTRETRDDNVEKARDGKPVLAEDNFQAKTPWQRLAIVLAGPFANFLLCYLLLFVGAVTFGIASDGSQPLIGALVKDSPADAAGLRTGDRLTAINGTPVASGKTLIETIHGSLGKTLKITYSRDGAETTASIVPKQCPAPESQAWGCIGFSPVPTFERVGFGQAVVASGYGFVNIANTTFGSIGMLVTHFTKYIGQTAGPIGMGQAAATIQDFGWGPYFQLAAMLSFALGLFNLLPIPALDGGRAAFIIAELLRGKPVDPEKEAMVHFAGFAVLIALMLARAFFDILRITNGNGVL
jgi:regulator of sigma E protease